MLRVLLRIHNCPHNYVIFEGGWKGLFNLEVATANVEEGAVVNFGNPAFVAQLILPMDTMGPFPHKQDLQNPLGTVVVQPFYMYVLAGVE